eukprot:CAMPEP_0194729002 /NCGR_PEP_ID=MMETSP0296-20130528/44095_1 /TAXON_ID=39354 /ORGANISM="Heterosigma akashiwo, Strain CCMP2393" /LENGTH=106 /DNA_ID=CAMNT_0039635269 /DNA_START=40 /DNA_END=358 /DNA_ORIENTATION=+
MMMQATRRRWRTLWQRRQQSVGGGGNPKDVQHTAAVQGGQVVAAVVVQQWEALVDGARMDGGGAKVYLQFMPPLGCLQETVWRGKAGGRRVLQLLSGHCCNLGGYL